ncbi:MAG TPA: glycosyltransferase family 4 protein [Verrucomicrobiae bacterium]|nr:glycosyltransferase family 4 protein [Verrucomicrobiae bacterium]
MANDVFMFQYLQEKIDKGFPVPQFTHLIHEGEFMYVPRGGEQKYVNPQRSLIHSLQGPVTCRVGMFFDGPFFPIRNGACYTIHNLMRALGDTTAFGVNFFNCFRGWDKIEAYFQRNFSSTFLTPNDYFKDTGVLEQALVDQGIQIAHFFDTEVLTTIAPLLRKLGIKIVLETQNIDHVLLERLQVSTHEIAKARDIQIEALKIADFNLFRSDIDMEWGVKLGARPATTATYRGGIWANDFTFKTRKDAKKLVFLGHMFYQPNENALHAIIAEILPKLSKDYTLTVIGITPPKIIDQYKNLHNVIFLKGVDDLDGTLQSYDIALAPLLEGSGTRLKLLDYLASGLPVIATTLAAEGLDAEISDLMTIEDDLEMYANRILEIASNTSYYQSRAQQGRKFVEQKYNWPNCIQPFLDAYRVLMNSEK